MLNRLIAVPAAIVLAQGLATGSAAQERDDLVTYTTEAPFEDVIFALENAIINEGLVVEGTSKVGEMLARTGPDVGSDVKVFENAQVFSFCSAVISRQVMEADPANVSFCPYDVFAYQLPDAQEVIVGFRRFPEGPMQAVQELLDRIAQEAASGGF